jgi:hypothetical protein
VLVTLAFTLAISLAIALGGCGAAEEQDFGVSHGERPPRPVELELRATDGAFVAIGDLRGRATVVYCFATYDGVSQAAVRPLSRFVRHHPEVNVVAIATQPNPQIFAEAWQAALSPPFLVTFDPEERIIEGTTDLGHISAVPTYILLDANGVEVDRHVGFASQNRLEGMLAQAETR